MKSYDLIGHPVAVDDTINSQDAADALQKVRDIFNDTAKLCNIIPYKTGAIRRTWLTTSLRLKCEFIRKEEDLSMFSVKETHTINIQLCDEMLRISSTPQAEYVYRKAAKTITSLVEEAERDDITCALYVRQISFSIAL